MNASRVRGVLGAGGVFEIDARVVNDGNVANKVFRAETPSGSTSVDKAVEAMNASADRRLCRSKRLVRYYTMFDRCRFMFRTKHHSR
jgi:hypothetical protein